MARRSARPQPDQTIELPALTRACPACSAPLWAAYMTQRSVTTLSGTVRLRLQVRRCRGPRCPRRAVPLRPEQEGRYALPEHEFGLDVVALIGTLRHAQHRSAPEIHAELTRRGVPLCLRTVTNLLDRYDERLALSLADTERLRRVTAAAGRVILAIDGLRPDVGHEVLWVIRDCLGGEVLFHYLREAARPIYEADRHAKKELKKQVRGVRPIERKAEGRDDSEAKAIRGYCAAVRSALTDDGRPPLSAPGLVLKGRLKAVVESLDRVEEKGGSRPT